MPAYFSGTTNALKKGATKMSAEAAIKKIEGWEEAYRKSKYRAHAQFCESRRAQASTRSRRARWRPHTDDFSRLADATMKISDRVEDRNADKVRDLGQALETASEEDEEEEMDKNQESRRSSSQRASSARSSSQRYRDEDEEDHRGPSGRVRDPEHDHRLRGHETERLD